MRLTLLLLALMQILSADISDCLKLPESKEEGHSMPGIDFIYLINLDKRPEKFAHCQEELAPYGISPYRFSAVNGWELNLEQINSIGYINNDVARNKKRMGTYYPVDQEGKFVHSRMDVLHRNYFSHCMARGTIGIVLSHLSILQDALNSGYDTIWVMEDDIKVIRDPRELSGLIERLDQYVGKEGWDILFTDRDTKNQKGEYVPCTSHAWRPNFTPSRPDRFTLSHTVGKEFRRVGARYGAYSMIIRRSGMEKILNFILEHQIFLPYDMDFYLPDDIRLYTVLEDVVSTLPNALSDNGTASYQK